MGQQAKVGIVNGEYSIKYIPNSASLTFADGYGHFVNVDSSGDLVLSVTSAVTIIGWALAGTTAFGTAQTSYIPVNIHPAAVYRIPCCSAGVAVTEANLVAALGKTCDIYTSSTSQYADIETSGAVTLLIVDYEYYGSTLGQQYVHVMMNQPGITTRTGV